jgi:Holliday junction resolvasome RuvABC ATP-dependent DNA helicase subunit
VADPSLRYAELIGQEEAVARLKAFTELFASSSATPGHILLTGETGMGQSTIARAVSNDCGGAFSELSAESFEVPGDFTALVTNFRKGQVLLLSDLQLLRKLFVGRLRTVMRDSKLTISIGQGPAIRNHVMEIPPFTLIATCPRKSDCPADLLDEFSLILSLKPYSMDELHALAISIGKGSGISLEPKAAELVAKVSDGKPGRVASILRRLSKAINKTEVTEEDVSRAFKGFGIAVRSDTSPDGVGRVRDLSGVDFESLIMGLLTRMGFHAEMTRTTGDGGIDIIAMLDKPIVGGRYLFQCKRFAPENMVGAPTVRDFYGAVTADRAAKGIFITTSSFTPQAREFAEKAGVELIDLRQLEKLFLEYGVAAMNDE